MRFPWLQVDADFIGAHAGDLSAHLGISRREAMGLALDLWTWALARAGDDAPPDGLVTGTGPVPDRLLAGSVGWTGPAEAFSAALVAVGMAVRVDDGYRLTGFGRYKATWEKNRRRSGGKPERNRTGTGEEPARKTQTQTQTQKEEKKETLSAAADLQVPLLQVAPTQGEHPEDLQGLWNAEAHPDLPRWLGMSDKRKRQAAARLRERPLQAWREVIRRISASAFCRGEKGDRGWKATPDWLLQADTADRVLEGKYDSGPAAAERPAGVVAAQAGEACAVCSHVGDGANLQQPGGERLWLGYACGCCSGWTAEVQAGAHYSGVYEWAQRQRAGRAA